MRDSSLSLLRGTIGETVRFFIAFLKLMKSDFSFSLKCNKETYRLIQDLRGGFNLFLQKKICEPSPVDWSSEEGALLRYVTFSLGSMSLTFYFIPFFDPGQ